jgi:DNA-directed RNA polymerase specialized sigma24 family protein
MRQFKNRDKIETFESPTPCMGVAALTTPWRRPMAIDQIVSKILLDLKPLIDRRGRRWQHDELFEEVAEVWFARLGKKTPDDASAVIRITWGIVRNLLRQFHRKQRLRCRLQSMPRDITSFADDPLSKLIARERNAIVNDAIGSLPKEDREIIRARSSLKRSERRSAYVSTDRGRYRRAIRRLQFHPRVIELLVD